MSIARQAQIFPMTPAADQTGLEGYFVTATGTDGKTATVVTSAAAIPFGVITEGFPAVGSAKSSVAASGFHGTPKVKLGPAPGAVIRGSYLILNADGTAKLDPGPGTARVRVARACEPGNANELIEAYLVEPLAGT